MLSRPRWHAALLPDPVLRRARAADADREEVQAETELQERALDGIGAALGDMHRLTRVRVPCHGSNKASRMLLCT